MVTSEIGYFRISLNLFLKASIGAHPFIWKWDFIHLQIKLIFIWWRGLGELGNGLLRNNLEFWQN